MFSFIAETSLIKKFNSISNRIKISETDIARLNHVSHSTVSRYIDNSFNSYRPDFLRLPKNISFNEFKSTKDAKGSLSFIFTDSQNKRIIEIVENRQLSFLIKFFSKFTKEARFMVEAVYTDIYTPYMSLIKEMFLNAKVILDRFHIINLSSRALNRTGINTLNNFSTKSMQYKRLKKILEIDT